MFFPIPERSDTLGRVPVESKFVRNMPRDPVEHCGVERGGQFEPGFEPGPEVFADGGKGHERADEFGFGRSGFFEVRKKPVRSILYFVLSFIVFLPYMSL